MLSGHCFTTVESSKIWVRSEWRLNKDAGKRCVGQTWPTKLWDGLDVCYDKCFVGYI